MKRILEATLVRRYENFHHGTCGVLKIKSLKHCCTVNTLECPEAILPDGDYSLARLFFGPEHIEFGLVNYRGDFFDTERGDLLIDFLDFERLDPEDIIISIKTEITNDIFDLLIF